MRPLSLPFVTGPLARLVEQTGLRKERGRIGLPTFVCRGAGVSGRKRLTCALAGVSAVLLVAAGVTGCRTVARPVGALSAITSPSVERAVAVNAGLALGFVENRGQTSPRVRFYARGDGYAFYLTRDEVMLAFAKKGKARDLALALRFIDRNPASEPVGVGRAAGEVNYLSGNDPTKWQTRLGHYGQVVYHDLWPRIDLRVRQQAGVLKYEFLVRPGGRPSDIRLAYVGAQGVALGVRGELLIETALGALRDAPPLSYQEIAGSRVPVKSRYSLDGATGGSSRFGFGVDRYHLDRELVIDPGIEFTTLLGGSSDDIGAGIAVDGFGNAYTVGTTQSPDFPTTAGAFRRTGATGNVSDVFVSKLNPTGTALVYSTFLGGSGFDSGRGIAIDAAGHAYVTGQTTSSNFPTTGGAFSRSLHIPPNCPRCGAGDNYDGFVTKLNASGSGLLYSTYLGGTDIDSPRGIAIDGAGNAYITGETVSIDFPTTSGAYSRTEHGSYDMFVTKVNATGSGLVYSTYLGGTQSDVGTDIARDSAGNIYVTGHTTSIDFPATTGAFDIVPSGGDAFVTKLALGRSSSTPPAPPPVPAAPALVSPADADTPAQPITFAWNNVAAAASYTIQIANASTFGAPLEREATVTTTLYATTDLSTATYFWRVRGVNAAGVGGAWSAVRSFTPQAPPPPAVLSTMSTNPSTVVGGNDSFGTVVLSVPAPAVGAVVGLSSSNPQVASVPASVAIPAVGLTGSFTITSFPIGANTTIGITASYNGTTRTATLTITPPAPAPAPANLQSVAVSPASVTGGSGAQGTVTLSAGAPSAGAAVSLSSSNPGSAAVPASVTVAAGATTATFSVSTTAVSASTAVAISASYNGATQTASFTVTPAAPPPQTGTLIVVATGRDGEQVSSSPAGVAVATGSSGSASFTIGTAITLSVSNDRDAIWSGACSSGGNKAKTCTFTLAGSATVAANVQ